jgi:hypothetical protein
MKNSSVRSPRRRMARGWSALALAAFGLVACGGADASSGTSDGGGGMQAGAPTFETFDVSATAACEDGNAQVTMSYTTLNAVDMRIKIGTGNFEETAGYGPNETSVIADIPCTGAGESSVQMQGCVEDGQCADSPIRHVTITA